MKNFIPILVMTLLVCGNAAAQERPQNPKPFGMWLEEFKHDALAQGISQQVLDDAFANTAPVDRVIELDHKQPESVLTLDRYLHNTLTAKRIKDGRKYYTENQALLKKIGSKYGVQPRFIVALMGIETGYGRNTGGFETLDVLATLAYDGRRSDYFRTELINALHIVEAEQMSATDLKGSWAGALGQCQFMPSTFLKYAVDYDQDGKRDIWNNKSDVYASIANYLKSLKWNSGLGWGRPVKLPDDFDKAMTDITMEKPLSEWHKLGVRKSDGSALPAQKIMASVIYVGEGDDAEPYLIYSNYKALLKWNRSRFFATAVGSLADKIAK